MRKKILIDDKETHFSKVHLPMLIHGGDDSGASLFSVSVMADLYSQDENIVFLCGYHMARDEFSLQTQSVKDSIVVQEGFNVGEIEDKRVIFIPSEQPELLRQVLELLSDLDERVVYFKNFDLFRADIFSAVENVSKLVMMGDIDKCNYKTRILEKNWATQIFFSVPQTELGVSMPKIEKYKGYLISENIKGVVSLRMT